MNVYWVLLIALWLWTSYALDRLAEDQKDESKRRLPRRRKGDSGS